MNFNNLNDISKLYLEQVVESAVPGKPAEKLGAVTAIPKNEQDAARERTLAKAKAMRKKKGIEEAVKEKKAKRWWDDDGDGKGYEEGEVSGKFKRKKKVEEAKEKPKFWWDDDGDGKGYEEGEVSGKFKRKKKVTKESFSNWREDLIEVAGKVKIDKSEEPKIVEKEVNNTVKINPNLDLGEAIEELGGELLGIEEIEKVDCIFDNLSESEVFLLSNNLIESVVGEFFQECIEEGYDIDDVENAILESIEFSLADLNEAKVTYGHDSKVKNDRLQKVKSAVGSELHRIRYKGTKKTERPTIARRIASSLKSGLKKIVAKGARKVAKGALGVARKMEKEKPSSVHSKFGARTARPRSGIGGGKRIEVAGEQPVKKVSVKDVTPKKPKAQKAPVGTPENPRIGQPGSDKPKAKTTKVSTKKGFGSFKQTEAGEKAYQEAKAKIESRKPKPKPKDQDNTGGKLDDLLKSIKKENYQLSEKAESEQQQKLFGLALSVKRGKTPRSEVSAEVLKIVDTMSEKKIRDFAKTSHEGLPKKVQTKEEAIREQLLYRMISKIEEQGIEQAKSPDSSTTSQVFQAQQRAASAKKELATKLRMAATKGVDVSLVSL